jgi:hypothetical protein
MRGMLADQEDNRQAGGTVRDGYADRRMGRQSAPEDEKVDGRKERMMEMRKPNRSAAGRRAG